MMKIHTFGMSYTHSSFKDERDRECWISEHHTRTQPTVWLGLYGRKRMLLGKRQARLLIKLLERFVRTGGLRK